MLQVQQPDGDVDNYDDDIDDGICYLPLKSSLLSSSTLLIRPGETQEGKRSILTRMIMMEMVMAIMMVVLLMIMM